MDERATELAARHNLDYSEELEELIYSYKVFCSKLSQDIDSCVKDDRLVLKKDVEATFFDFLPKIVTLIKQNQRQADYINFLKDIYPADKFYSMLNKIIESYVKLYSDTSLLRDAKEDELKVLFRDVLDNRILIADIDYFEDIEENERKIKQDKYEMAQMILEYSISIVISNRCSFKYFQREFAMKFGFSEKMNEFIWDLIQKNKQDLTNRYIIEKLDQIEEELERIHHIEET